MFIKFLLMRCYIDNHDKKNDKFFTFIRTTQGIKDK